MQQPGQLQQQQQQLVKQPGGVDEGLAACSVHESGNGSCTRVGDLESVPADAAATDATHGEVFSEVISSEISAAAAEIAAAAATVAVTTCRKFLGSNMQMLQRVVQSAEVRLGLLQNKLWRHPSRVYWFPRE